MLGRKFKIEGWRERCREYFKEKVYVKHAFLGIVLGYIIYIITLMKTRYSFIALSILIFIIGLFVIYYILKKMYRR